MNYDDQRPHHLNLFVLKVQIWPKCRVGLSIFQTSTGEEIEEAKGRGEKKEPEELELGEKGNFHSAVIHPRQMHF